MTSLLTSRRRWLHLAAHLPPHCHTGSVNFRRLLAEDVVTVLSGRHLHQRMVVWPPEHGGAKSVCDPNGFWVGEFAGQPGTQQKCAGHPGGHLVSGGTVITEVQAKRKG